MIEMRLKPLRIALVLAVAVGLLPGAAAQARALPAADIQLPSRFEGPSPAPRNSAPSSARGEWWKVFGDPQLDALIEHMHAGNTGIQQAAARLSAARARARLGSASRAPQVGFDASASRAGGPLINKAGGSGSLFTADLSISWEADLLGRLSGERAAGKLDASATEAVLREVRLLMEAATARSYFELAYLQLAQAEAARVAALWQEREAIAESRLRGGLSPQLDLGALRQRRIASAGEAATLDRDLAEARSSLAFLAGETAPPALAAQPLPGAPEIPAGLPSDVLARRPDVEAAITRLQAADRRLESARRSWFPLFSLTASGGAASPSLGQILSSSAQNFGLGMLFSLPLLDSGRHKAQVAGSHAELDLAKAQYREAMLAAFREVSDALEAAHSAELHMQQADQSLAIGETGQAIVARRLANGTISRAQAIDAQLAASGQRLAALEQRYRRLVASIDLIKAIGGGWALPPIPHG